MDVRDIGTKGYKEFADTLRRASEENHPAAMWLQSLCGEAADYLETLLYIHDNAYSSYRALGTVEELTVLVNARKDGRVVVLNGESADKDGEEALRVAMYCCGVINNSVTRYTADAIAEKLTRADAASALGGGGDG